MSTTAGIVGYYVVDGVPVIVSERWGAVTAWGRHLPWGDWIERAEPISPSRYLQLVAEGRSQRPVTAPNRSVGHHSRSRAR